MLSLPRSVEFLERAFLPSMTVMEANTLQICAVGSSMRYAHLPFRERMELTIEHVYLTFHTHALSLQYFRNVMERNPTLPIRDILCRTFLDLNNKIFEVAEANKDCSDDPGSTAVIAFLGVKSNGADEGGMRAQVLDTIEPINPGSHRVLYCANVGDSRGVICRGGEAFRVSCDHDIKSNEAEKDRVQALKTPEEEKIIWNDRILGDLEVTRSLGDHYYKDWVTADPCTYEMELDDEDEFIILASDGVSCTKSAALARLTHVNLSSQLWKEVDDQKAVNHVRYTRDPKKAAENLVKLALETPSRDNITVIVIRLRGFASE